MPRATARGSKDTHFVLELMARETPRPIQNADDNDYGEGVVPSLRFQFSRDQRQRSLKCPAAPAMIAQRRCVFSMTAERPFVADFCREALCSLLIGYASV